MRLFNEIVLDVWNARLGEAKKLRSKLEAVVRQKQQRLDRIEEIVEVVVTPEEIVDGFAGLAFNEFEEPVARGMLGTVAHARAAAALDASLRRLL